MAKGTAHWSHDARGNAWWFLLNERAPPPCKRQVLVEAILDLDADGRLAGELLEPTPETVAAALAKLQ